MMNNENAKTTDKDTCQKIYERALARYKYAQRYALRDAILFFAATSVILFPLMLWNRSNKRIERTEACQEFCIWQQKDVVNFNRFGCVCK
jgi:hypothetical protein